MTNDDQTLDQPDEEEVQEGDERYQTDEHPDDTGEDVGEPDGLTEEDLTGGDPIPDDVEWAVPDNDLPDPDQEGQAATRGLVRLGTGQQATILRNLGWRVRSTNELHQSIRNFQRGYNLGPALYIDGVVGPLTTAALLKSEARRRAGRGSMSDHFSFTEFWCKCGGAYASCQRIWQSRKSVQAMEQLRDHLGGSPLRIISGCRCPSHNRAVGGVSASQHMRGTACDVHLYTSHGTVASWHLFGGIGYAGSNGQVRHVDVRDGHDEWVYTKW